MAAKSVGIGLSMPYKCANLISGGFRLKLTLRTCPQSQGNKRNNTKGIYMYLLSAPFSVFKFIILTSTGNLRKKPWKNPVWTSGGVTHPGVTTAPYEPKLLPAPRVGPLPSTKRGTRASFPLKKTAESTKRKGKYLYSLPTIHFQGLCLLNFRGCMKDDFNFSDILGLGILQTNP